MTLFTYECKVPKNTPKTNPATFTLKLRRGCLYKIEIMFPPGCHGLVGVRFYYGDILLYPENPKEWIIGSGETISWLTTFDIIHEPAVLILKAFNQDEMYDHTVYIRINVLPKLIAYPSLTVARLINLIRRVFGV